MKRTRGSISMKKRILITVGIILAAALIAVGGVAIYERYQGSQIRYDGYPPYIVYNGTFYKNVSSAAQHDIQKEGYTETDVVITNLVDSNVRSEVDGTTNVAGYLNGVVYANDQYPGMIYLRLSGGEDDGKYSRFCTPEEYP